MLLSILKEIILDFQTQKIETGVRRHFEYSPIENKAFVCIGVRRCGKSTLLFQIIKDLRVNGVRKENIMYINFFDDRLTELRTGNISLVLDAYYALYPGKKGAEEIYCFFDEIQEVSGWEAFLDRIMRTEKCRIFLTGSSSKMLSKEIATEMRGRSLVWELFPFSFREFLDHKGTAYARLTSKASLLIQRDFKEYFVRGGFPEVRDLTERMRIMVHQEYYKTILYRDVIERFDAIHPQAVMQLGYRLLTSVSSLYSLNRLTDYLKSLGFKVSKEFVSLCIQWFEDCFFMFSVKIFSRSYAKQNVNMKKIYCIDHSLISSIDPNVSEKHGYLLENIIFLALRRKTDNIFYYRTKSGREIDFIWVEASGKAHLIQVCYSLRDQVTRKRELSALYEAMEELGCNTARIITFEERDSVGKDGRLIEIIPAWDFLLKTDETVEKCR